MSEDDAYLDKSPAAGRMGKAAEYLVAAACILATGGELNVSTSIVDDEGVDLVFHRRGSSATLGVQVKARMSTTKVVQDEKIMAFVQAKTFRPRDDLDMLFAAIDVERGAIMISWLVPSPAFGSMIKSTTAQGHLRFAASMKQQSADRWTPYRLSTEQLPHRIMSRLSELEKTGHGSL